MSNLGFNHAMGAARMGAELGNMESRRRQAQTEMDRLNAQAQGAAIGSLVGTGVGMIKGGYDAYKQDQVDQDVERGIQARKEYGVLTDTKKPATQRISEVYGSDVADVVKERADSPPDLLREMHNKGLRAGRGSMHRDMADVVKLEPRVSQTKGILGGTDTQLVSNNPWRDFHAASKFFDGLIGD